MRHVAGRILVLAAAFLASASVGWGQDQKNVALFDDCAEGQVTCPIFQVAIKHRELASSSRAPGPVVRVETQPSVPVNPQRPTPSPAPVNTSPKPSNLVLSYGLYVASDTVECTKTAHVPGSVFRAMKAVMTSIENGTHQNGGSVPALTPAQQTMLLFYTTIMQQTLNFDCSFNGASLGRNIGETP